MNDQKKLMRLAVEVHDALCQPATAWLTNLEHRLSWLYQELALLEPFRQRLHKCASRGWQGAAIRSMTQLQYRLNTLRSELCRCEEALHSDRSHGPSLGQVHDELRQAQEEFGEVRYDVSDGTISVETDPIRLKGIDLGRFEIRLLLGRLREGSHEAALRVVALEPHPAGSNSLVTHPHVSDEHLCAGEASASLSPALRAGRLCDAFLLVRSVLETYNPDSPYVSLDSWDGTPCYDCGYPASEDSIYRCEGCDQDLCDECISYCRSCDTSLCRGCLADCARCEDPFCESCLEPCRECSEACCPACLEDHLCSACLEEMEQDDEQAEGPTSKTDQGEVAAPSEGAIAGAGGPMA